MSPTVECLPVGLDGLLDDTFRRVPGERKIGLPAPYQKALSRFKQLARISLNANLALHFCPGNPQWFVMGNLQS